MGIIARNALLSLTLLIGGFESQAYASNAEFNASPRVGINDFFRVKYLNQNTNTPTPAPYVFVLDSKTAKLHPLSFEEMDQVKGDFIPVVVGAVVRCMANVTCKVAVQGVGLWAGEKIGEGLYDRFNP